MVAEFIFHQWICAFYPVSRLLSLLVPSGMVYICFRTLQTQFIPKAPQIWAQSVVRCYSIMPWYVFVIMAMMALVKLTGLFCCSNHSREMNTLFLKMVFFFGIIVMRTLLYFCSSLGWVNQVCSP